MKPVRSFNLGIMKQKILLTILLPALLSACTQQIVTPTPTLFLPDIISTAVALTSQSALATQNVLIPTATETPPPTQTFTPVPTSSEPTLTPTPEPGFTKFAEMRFVSPGPMSSLVSPFDLKLLLTAGKSDRVRVDLLGEDGRTLYSDMLRVDHSYAGTYRDFEVTFEIRAVSENGYLRLSTRDENKNLQSLNTMPVLLYSVGATQLNLPGNLSYERISYDGLKNNSKVYGGEIKIKGLYWPYNEQPVFLDLVFPDGRVVATRQLAFSGIEPQTFETTLPYTVTEPTPARIAIHQENPILSVIDPILKNYIYYHSIEIVLNP